MTITESQAQRLFEAVKKLVEHPLSVKNCDNASQLMREIESSQPKEEIWYCEKHGSITHMNELMNPPHLEQCARCLRDGLDQDDCRIVRYVREDL